MSGAYSNVNSVGSDATSGADDGEVWVVWYGGRERREERRLKREGRREKGEGRREKGEGRREKGEGRRERREE